MRHIFDRKLKTRLVYFAKSIQTKENRTITNASIKTVSVSKSRFANINIVKLSPKKNSFVIGTLWNSKDKLIELFMRNMRRLAGPPNGIHYLSTRGDFASYDLQTNLPICALGASLSLYYFIDDRYDAVVRILAYYAIFTLKNYLPKKLVRYWNVVKFKGHINRAF
jgi:hypothetical protein